MTQKSSSIRRRHRPEVEERIRRKVAAKTAIIPSSGNVFADMGLPDAEELKKELRRTTIGKASLFRGDSANDDRDRRAGVDLETVSSWVVPHEARRLTIDINIDAELVQTAQYLSGIKSTSDLIAAALKAFVQAERVRIVKAKCAARLEQEDLEDQKGTLEDVWRIADEDPPKAKRRKKGKR